MPAATATMTTESARVPRGASKPRKAAKAAKGATRLPNFQSYPAIFIEDISPQVDGGRWPVKRVVGDEIEVAADVLKEGHDLLTARVLWRREQDRQWAAAPMALVANDRWVGKLRVDENTRYRYTVEAFTDVYGSWCADLAKRVVAEQDVRSELREGRRLVEEARARAKGPDAAQLAALLKSWRGDSVADVAQLALSTAVAALMARYPDTTDATRYRSELELIVDRERARFGAWYEIFPRSQGTDPTRGATFREAEARIPQIAAMGFDVLYLTPIHPIGETNRKGRNNSLRAARGDPGSPYAIGSAAGGHTAIHPELGTLQDFQQFQAAARGAGMELAMDFAIQVSPDHPWVKEHPDWFYHRPDGTIKVAENPPKKYEDIYPLNFRSPDWKSLWAALRDVVVFWVRQGVRIIRVDNPHTKPIAFWEWLIKDVQTTYPEVIFLAEAFTRPRLMQALAKAGFTQSYTYFTWRNTSWELREYLTELTRTPMAHYYRANFFANTPDILPEILQTGGRPAFRLRLVLAATLSSTYGVYSGYELCENVPREPDSEYYLDSEMYQYKVRDWTSRGNVIGDVTRVNQIRRENPALRLYDNVSFGGSDNETLLVYGKATPDLSNIILLVVNLDPTNVQAGWIDVPTSEWQMADDETYMVEDLLTYDRYQWYGRRNWVRLDPSMQPAHVFRVTRRTGPSWT